LRFAAKAPLKGLPYTASFRLCRDTILAVPCLTGTD
jgi:hypothetical protein